MVKDAVLLSMVLVSVLFDFKLESRDFQEPTKSFPNDQEKFELC